MWQNKWTLDLNTSNLPVAFSQTLEYVTENCFRLLIFDHTSKNPSKLSIPRSSGHHEWIRVEVLPLESVLGVWEGQSRSISGRILSLVLWFIFPINPPYHEVCIWLHNKIGLQQRLVSPMWVPWTHQICVNYSYIGLDTWERQEDAQNPTEIYMEWTFPYLEDTFQG